MKKISGVYAKGTKQDASQEWAEDDKAAKKSELTKTQKRAANKILEPYFDQMEDFART